MAWRPELASSLRHRDFRLLMGAFTGSAIGSWAYNVALAVWIFQETGSASWVGAATIGRFVPALLFSAYGGVIAERFERVRLMIVLDVMSCLAMVALAIETAVHAPVALAIATAAITSTLGTVYEPAVTAIMPQLVGERDLGSANALRNTIDNVTVIAGPGLGVLLLLLGPPPVAIAVNAASFLFSAIALRRIRARSKPVDVTEGGDVGAFRQMLVGFKAVVGSTSAATLVGYSVLASFVFGLDTVQFVIISRDALGTGAEGYGYLLAGLGVGGVLAATRVSRLEKLPRLGVVILAGMAVYTLPTLLFLVVEEPVAGFLIQALRGAGTLVVDVLALTALQRSVPNAVLARVFGAFNALVLAAILAGAVIAPIVINGLGLEPSLWLASVGISAVSFLGWPALRSMDRAAAARLALLAPRVQLLEACDLFAAVSQGPIERLAGAAEEIAVLNGETVVREGEEADHFFVIMSGSLSVNALGEGQVSSRLGILGAGDYFGEIGLIEGIPRTATVTAIEPAQLLRISGADFIGALTESAPSVAFLEGASMRLRRTHPSTPASRAALHPIEAE